MPLPKVAIVGRPNVGKSALLNRLVGRRVSIVHATPGVTRDRVSVKVEAGDRTFELTDTGGMGLDDPDNLTDHVEAQIWSAIHESDLLLFVVDAHDGVTPADREVLRQIRSAGKPMLLLVNKSERRAAEADAAEFLTLGLGEPLLVSALEGLGIGDLVSAILERLPQGSDSDAGSVVHLAIVGSDLLQRIVALVHAPLPTADDGHAPLRPGEERAVRLRAERIHGIPQAAVTWSVILGDLEQGGG